MSKLINTSKKEVRPEWLQGGNPEAIEQQEKRGQEQLVNNSVLPVRCNGKEKLEAAGVVFGNQLENDPLFCNALLPNGWKKVTTEHSMWTDLVDQNGKKKASIFYKAAFYDRDAFMNVE